MTNTNDHAEMVHCFWTSAQEFANQTHYADIECTMPSKVTLLWNFVRCVYQWTRSAVFSKSAALSLKYVLIGYIWPEKGVIALQCSKQTKRALIKQKTKTKQKTRQILACLRTNHNHRCVVCTYISSVSIDTSSQAPIFTRQIRLTSPSWQPC